MLFCSRSQESKPTLRSAGTSTSLDSDGTWSTLDSAGTQVSFDEEADTWRFVWNSRICTGSELHIAALEGEPEKVKQVLEKGIAPEDTFTWYTKVKDKPRKSSAAFWPCQRTTEDIREEKKKCTGQAIHLAASRGHDEVVQLLLQQGASVRAQVQRDGEYYYEVLHAAVFGEGLGGDQDMVRFLVNSRADIDAKNSDGKSVLHLAFQTGKVSMIKMLSSLKVQAIKGKLSPLEQGIELGKMSRKELAESAPPDVQSLKTFINKDPEVIPYFLDFINGTENLASICSSLTCEDLATVIKKSPQAANALLNAVHAKPKVRCQGWHPLPARVNFEPTCPWQTITYWLNQSKSSQMAFYQEERIWEYDAEAYEPPDWHKELKVDSKLSHDVRLREADIKVCNVPNIISVSMFQALTELDDHAESEVILKHQLIRSVTRFTYWNGPCQVDIFSFGLNCWVLASMVGEFMAFHLDGNIQTRPNEVFRSSIHFHSERGSVTGDLILARSVLFLLHELAQLFGCIYEHKLRSYFTMDNFMDALFWIVPLLMTIWSHCVWLDIILLLMYWMSLLGGVVNYVELLAEHILPIRKLGKRLIPALLVTALAGVACVNALFVLESSYAYKGNGEYDNYHIFRQYYNYTDAKVGKEVFKDIFSLLMTNSVPNTPEGPKAMLAVYLSTIVFAVFFMNIFLGVIMDGFQEEKQRWTQTLTRIRARSSHAFLLRRQLIPTQIFTTMLTRLVFSPTQIFTMMLTRLVFCFALCLAITLQLKWAQGNSQGDYEESPWKPLVLLTLWGIMKLCAYQNHDSRTTSTSCAGRSLSEEPELAVKNRYFWTCVPTKSSVLV